MDLNTLLEREVGLSLHRILISGKKSQEGPSKIRIRPVQLKGELYFQCQETRGTKEFHKNLKKEELIVQIMGWMAQDFKQLQLESANGMGTVLVSKKGKVTVKWKACMNGTGRRWKRCPITGKRSISWKRESRWRSCAIWAL